LQRCATALRTDAQQHACSAPCVRKGLATRFEGLPDVHYGNEEHFVDETANAGMSKWLLTGTTPGGVKVKVRGCDFYTFRDDRKVIRKDSYWKIIE
jgi:hypothetical protein